MEREPDSPEGNITRAQPDVPVAAKTQSAMDKILVLLRMRTGNDFSLYKKSTVFRRIERRMGLHQIDHVGNYVRYLRENPKESELLFKELLIGVTSFFRDPAAWDRLSQEVLPALLSERASGSALRAWVPGCSTGEEAYSLAIAFREALERLKAPKNIMLQVFATDLDRDAIERARQGLYPTNIAADVSPERLRRFFYQEERGFRVSKEIREMVVFAPQNVIKDGTHRWFKTRAVPIRTEQGAISKWYGTHTDVDDLKRAGEERRLASERLASILEGVSDGFFALDEDLTVTYFNAAAEKLLGRGREEVLGKNFLEAFPETRGSVFDEKYRQAVRDKAPASFEAALEQAPRDGAYSVQVHPHAEGISVFFQRRKVLRPEVA